MTARAESTLVTLARLRGVRAAILATESDGLAAAAVSTVGVSEDALAAFATALLRRTRLANEAAGYGSTHFLALDAQGGRLFIAAQGDLAVIVLGERDANTGLIRVAMQRTLGALATDLGTDGLRRSGAARHGVA
jgi:predicted regulator of Ras-like GTPase activity (Roadblock/LC7/MglB family)